MIQSHAPQNYICPICLGVQGVESSETLIRPSDVVFRDELVTVLINSFFMGQSAGHAIVVPNQHFENLYDLPPEYGYRIFDVTKMMAKILKEAYNCDGITIRQNSEPAGDQHAFHFHQHIFPRYNGDDFNSQLPEDKRLAEPDERAEYAEKLKKHLQKS